MDQVPSALHFHAILLCHFYWSMCFLYDAEDITFHFYTNLKKVLLPCPFVKPKSPKTMGKLELYLFQTFTIFRNGPVVFKAILYETQGGWCAYDVNGERVTIVFSVIIYIKWNIGYLLIVFKMMFTRLHNCKLTVN